MEGLDLATRYFWAVLYAVSLLWVAMDLGKLLCGRMPHRSSCFVLCGWSLSYLGTQLIKTLTGGPTP